MAKRQPPSTRPPYCWPSKAPLATSDIEPVLIEAGGVEGVVAVGQRRIDVERALGVAAVDTEHDRARACPSLRYRSGRSRRWSVPMVTPAIRLGVTCMSTPSAPPAELRSTREAPVPALPSMLPTPPKPCVQAVTRRGVVSQIVAAAGLARRPAPCACRRRSWRCGQRRELAAGRRLAVGARGRGLAEHGAEELAEHAERGVLRRRRHLAGELRQGVGRASTPAGCRRRSPAHRSGWSSSWPRARCRSPAHCRRRRRRRC